MRHDDAEHAVAADSPYLASLGSLAQLARLAAERPPVRPPMTDAEQQSLPMSELKTPEAASLSDLSLIVLDLRAVMQICDRLLVELSCDPQDGALIEALWTAALVKYVRCFTSGKRSGVTEKVFDGLEGDPAGAHRYFKDMRDKHIAHSVNPFEEVRVGLVLSADETAVEGVAVLSRKLLCTGADGVGTLRRLATAVHGKICAWASDVQTQILKWAQQQPIQSFPVGPLGLFTPGSDQAGKPRE